MRYKLFFVFLFIGCAISAQNRIEREHRILKSQFPEEALAQIQEKLKDVKRLRFYKEVAFKSSYYKAKFKKDRLWYRIDFTQKSELKSIQVAIKTIDIPEDVLLKITSYLATNFTKHRIRKIYQQYAVNDIENAETTIENAFQNLILPSITYEFIISIKKEKNYKQFQVLFDAEGDFQNLQKSLPPNYDHVLY